MNRPTSLENFRLFIRTADAAYNTEMKLRNIVMGKNAVGCLIEASNIHVNHVADISDWHFTIICDLRVISTCIFCL